jgi:hypothetical protein
MTQRSTAAGGSEARRARFVLLGAALLALVAACSSGPPSAPRAAPAPPASIAPSSAAWPERPRPSQDALGEVEPQRGVRPLARPGQTSSAPDSAWSADGAIGLLRDALHRRGEPPEVVDGVMAPVVFDPHREVVHLDGGESETIAAGGAWRVLTYAGEFWVFESGLALPAGDAAPRPA